MSGSGREETEHVSATSQSTYKIFSKGSGSKMSGGSSVRSLPRTNLKATRDEIKKYSGLAQSHAVLPTAITRAWISTLRTRNLHLPTARK